MPNEELARQFLAASAEDRLSLNEVSQLVGVSLPAVFVWVSRGARGVRLESITIGGEKRCGRRLVLRSWLADFLAATQNKQAAARRHHVASGDVAA